MMPFQALQENIINIKNIDMSPRVDFTMMNIYVIDCEYIKNKNTFKEYLYNFLI